MEAEMRLAHGAEISKGTMGVDDYTARAAAMAKELEEMRRRLQMLDAQAAAAQERIGEEMAVVQESFSLAAPQENKIEVDSRSIYVGNVDYACTPEAVEQHFQSCGTVNRVTIPVDKFHQPKGYAYLEFLETEAVQKALLLNETHLYGRLIKVAAKRTNVPGMKRLRPRRFFCPYTRPYMPHYMDYTDDVADGMSD